MTPTLSVAAFQESEMLVVELPVWTRLAGAVGGCVSVGGGGPLVVTTSCGALAPDSRAASEISCQ